MAYELGEDAKAYQRYLNIPQQRKAHETAEKLAVLDVRLKLWVRDSLSVVPEEEHLRPPPYTITVTAQTTVEDIRKEIHEKSGLGDVSRSAVRSKTDVEEEVIAEASEFGIGAPKGSKAVMIPRHVRDRPKIQLVYCGERLEDGHVFGDYPFEKEQKKWSKPYAGVIWVSPYHINPVGFAHAKWM